MRETYGKNRMEAAWREGKEKETDKRKEKAEETKYPSEERWVSPNV